MFKKNVQFDDLEGNTVQQVFYFNFSKVEIIEMMEVDRLEDKIKRLGISAAEKEMTDPENTREAYEIFKDLILRAYGKKSDDGRSFYKKDPVTGRPYSDELEASPAWSEMVIEFLQNPGLGAQFVEQCLPKKLVEEAKQQQKAVNPTNEDITEMVELAAARQNDPDTRIEPGTLPAGVEAPEPKKFEEYSEEELLSMPQEQFKTLIPSSPQDMTQQQLMIAFRRKNQQ